MRHRISDLSPLDDLPARDALIAGCEREYDALGAGDDALTGTAQAARHTLRDEVKAK